MKNSGILIISLAVVLSVGMLARTYKNRHNYTNNISVTGLGSKDFTADLIVWEGSFNRKSMDFKEASAALGKDREIIRAYLISKGIAEKDIVFSSVDISKDYDETTDKEYHTTRTFTGYLLKQSISLESHDIPKIESISREVTDLIDKGVEFYSDPPSYYYTKLSELKIDLLAAATKDGQNRAQKIAENAGSKLGKLKSADMGIFQIVAQNSDENYSWGGAYNTTSYYKTATITVKLVYAVE